MFARVAVRSGSRFGHADAAIGCAAANQPLAGLNRSLEERGIFTVLFDRGEQTFFMVTVLAERGAEGRRHPRIVGGEREEPPIDVAELQLFQVERGVERLVERRPESREAFHHPVADRLELRRVDGSFLLLRGRKASGMVEQRAVYQFFVRQLPPQLAEW